ncbi:hypothetical protein DCC81_03585 [Chitinophaga parva]|uniref:Uncharacterized protein n=1 Tax=Chitinophaga parva TaxID=2169414 RepID=A0A2T7BLL7_9BACT|nr:hypothetical protein [Chitinophaga parva]PUZ28575.1 hypothetical protein DCC81_03585 [Chitinophaga parva]
MERQWKYQLSIDGAIIKVPSDGRLLQKTKEISYYNHLATALQGLLQLNMYGFDDQFGPERQQNKWNRLYNSAGITQVETGKPVVTMLNLPIADNHRNPFLQPGLYLSFDIGIHRFEKLAGLSLEPLGPMDLHMARLTSYEFDHRQTLVINPGLADLKIAIIKKQELEALEQYRLSLKGQPTATIYQQTAYHFHNLPDSFSHLVSTDLQRMQSSAANVMGPNHGIAWVDLEYGSRNVPVASLIREDRSKVGSLLQGAYIFTTSDPRELERHSGVELSGLPAYQNGNLHYLQVAILNHDGKVLQPLAALQKIRDSLTADGQAPFSIRYHHQIAGAAQSPNVADSSYSERTFPTLYTAMLHFLAAGKDLLGKPLLDDRPVSSIELVDNRRQQTAGHLFRQKTNAGQLAAGYNLKVDPDYLVRAFREIESPLKQLQRDKDLHIVLSSFTEKTTLKKNTPKTRSRRKPPPGQGGKSI